MKLSTRIIAAVLSVTTLVSGSTLAASAAQAVNAGNNKIYIKEMKIAYGNNEQEAKNWLSARGYTPVDGNLNKSNSTVTVMGYKTTTNVNEAITDLAVMPMGNGYSIDAYKDMLDTYKESVIDPFVQSYMPAIEEYRENVEAGRPQAITAQAILNSYTDGFAIPDTKPEEWTNMTNDEYDEYKAGFAAISAKWNDTDKDLGDAFAYGELRSEVSEAEYEANPTDYVDFSKLILQCDPDVLSVIRQALAMGADTDPNQNWLQRLEDAGPDCLTDNFEDYFPAYAGQSDYMTEDDKLTAISAAYENDAKRLAAGFKAVADDLEWYSEYPVHIEDQQDDVDDHFDALETAEGERERIAQFTRWTNTAVLYDALENIDYEGDWGDTLLDFFYDPDNPVDRTDSYEDFYPFAAQLSDGQRAGLAFTPLLSLVSYGIRDEEAWDEAQDEVEDKLEELGKSGVYANVNREIYEGGVALTSEAMRKRDLEGSDPYDSVIHSASYRVASNTLLITGIIGCAVGLTVFFKARSAAAYWVQKASRLRSSLEEATNDCASAFERFNKYNKIKLNPVYNDSGRIVIDQNTTMSPEVFEANFQSYQSNYHYMNNTAVPRAQAEFEDGYDLAMANADKARMWEYIGAGVSIGFGLMAIAGGIMKIIDLANYYEPEYDEIPRYIVDEKDITKEDENGNTIVLHNDFAYYKVVTCNRKAKGTSGDSNHNWWTSGAKTNVDKYTQWGCGDYGDLNGDVGKGWLALYTETNPEHDPIEAGTFVVKFNDEVPSGYDNAIHLFGSSAAVNLNSSRWDFNADTTYVYYKTDHIHTFTHGDVNNDGMIDIKDATEIQRYAAQFIELDSTALAAADVSGDGNVTIADATKIQRYIAKLINELVTVST